MIPAIDIAKPASIDFQIREYEHSSKVESYGLEAVQKLGIHLDQVFTTLMLIDQRNLFIAIIPVPHQLNLKLIGQVLGIQKVGMAEKREVEIATGYLVGGVSPIGQKNRLQTVIDS